MKERKNEKRKKEKEKQAISSLRTTSALPASFAARNTIKMDDLLDQVIHSIVTEEASRPP